MEFQTLVSQIVKSEKLNDSFLLKDMRLSFSDDERDIIQYIQVSLLSEACPNFVQRIVNASRSGSVAAEVDKISSEFDKKQIPCRIYSYFIYSVLKACGVNSDSVEWPDPSKKQPSDNGTFGQGAFNESTKDYVIDTRDFLTGYSGKSSVCMIPEGVKGIKIDTFKSKNTVKYVFAPDSLTDIDEQAFLNCEQLEAVYLPESVVEIPVTCFSGCKNLCLAGCKGVRKIGVQSFYNTGIASLNHIGNGMLEDIDKFAFARCEKLRDLPLMNAKHIGEGTFKNCASVSKLAVNSAVDLDGISQTLPSGKSKEIKKLSSLFVRDYVTYKDEDVNVEEIVVKCDNGEIPDYFFAGMSSVKRITIEGDVNKIGEGVFADCLELETIDMNYTGNSIPAYAFINCPSLKDVDTITENIVEIGAHAFEGCLSIETVALRNPVKLGKGAYKDCTSLNEVSVSFSDGIIEEECFSGCTGVSDWNVWDGIKEIRSGAFEKCDFSNGLPILDGVHICKDTFKNASFGSSLTISGDTDIDKMAFEDVHVDSLTIESFKYAESMLFYQLFSKSKKRFVESNPSLDIWISSPDIPEGAFSGYSNISKIVFDATVNVVPKSAFSECVSLESVRFIASESITIGEGAFYRCKNLAHILLDSGHFGELGKSSLAECEKLDDLSLKDVGHIGEGALKNCNSIKRLSVNSAVTLDDVSQPVTSCGTASLSSLFISASSQRKKDVLSVEEIVVKCDNGELPDYFFTGMSSLKTITIEGEINKIGEGAFSDCFALESVEINYMGSLIPANAFKNCSKLKDIEVITKNVIEIGGYAFENCSSIDTVTIRNPVKLGMGTFKGCTSLEAVSVELSDGIIEEECFSGCTGVSEWDFRGTVTEIRMLAFLSANFSDGFAFSDGVHICSEAFKNAVFDSDFTIPTDAVVDELAFDGIHVDVLVIGSFGLSETTPFYRIFAESKDDFMDWNSSMNIRILTDTIPEGIFSDYTNIFGVTFGPDVTSVSARAFSGCSGLESVTFETSELVTIDDEAFSNCKSLAGVCFKDRSDDQSEINLSSYKKLGVRAFGDCVSIQSVVLDSNCEMSSLSFENCFGINKISIHGDIHEDSSPIYTYFAESADDFNTKFKEITELEISDCASIPDSYFTGLENVLKIVFKTPVKEIGGSVFSGMKSLEEIDGEYEGLIYADSVFCDCENLKSVFLADKVTLIGNESFKNCVSLKSLKFAEEITSIGYSCFENCTHLENIDGKFMCKTIPEKTFSGCNALNDFSFIASSDTDTVGPYAFENTHDPVIFESSKISAYAYKDATFGGRLVIPGGVKCEPLAFENATKFDTLVIKDAAIKTLSDDTLLPYRLFADDLADFAAKTTCQHLEVEDGLCDFAFEGWFGLNDVTVNLNENGVIPKGCFKDCTGIKIVRLTGSGITLGNESFKNCSHLSVLYVDSQKDYGNPDIEVLCMDGISNLGDEAFSGCKELNTIDIGSGCVMGADVFKDCLGVTTAYLSITPQSAPIYSMFGVNAETYASSGKIKNAVVIGSEFSDSFFEGCSLLEKIETRDHITSIGKYCFKGCNSLKDFAVVLEEAKIDESAFEGCHAIKGTDISGSVISLGQNCFADCVALECLAVDYSGNTIPGGCFRNCASLISTPTIKNECSIDGSAFENCTGIRTLKLNGIGNDTCATIFSAAIGSINSVEYSSAEISDGCFGGLVMLKDFVATNKITKIGSRAFYGDVNLTSVPSFDYIEQVGSYAFYGCAIEEIRFGRSLKYVGDGMLAACSKLKFVEIPAVFRLFGFLFDWKESDGMTEISQTYKGVDKTYYIPATLSSIQSYCDNKLPSGIFSGLHSDLTIDGQPKDIADHAFYRYDGNLSIDVSCVKRVDESAFSWASIDDIYLRDVVEIGAKAFYLCNHRIIKIGMYADKIARDSFSDANLVTIDAMNPHYQIRVNALFDLDYSRKIDITDSVCGEIVIPAGASVESNALSGRNEITSIVCIDVQSIGDNAFANCRRLKSIVIGGSPSSLGQNILNGCSNVSILDVPYIGGDLNNPATLEYFFGYSTKPILKNIKVRGGAIVKDWLPGKWYYDSDRIDSIDLETTNNVTLPISFLNSVFVNELILPSGVDKIEQNAFINTAVESMCVGPNSRITDTGSCLILATRFVYRYKNVSDLVINSDLTRIDKGAFDRNNEIKNLTIGEGVSESVIKEIISHVKGIDEICYEGKTTYDDMFAHLDSLTRISAPNIGSISKGMFKNDTHLTDVGEFKNVESIFDEAFSGCTSINRLSFQSQILFVSEHAFDDAHISCIDYNGYIDDKGENSSSCVNNVFVVGQQIFYVCKAVAGSLEINYNVDRILPRAFESCDKLTSIRFNGKVKEISDYAFANCKNLGNFELFDADIISPCILFGDTLEHITLPFIGMMDDDIGKHLSYLFSESGSNHTACAGIKSVRLTRQRVIDRCFEGCGNLSSVELGNETTEIRSRSFADCVSLDSISIPKSIVKVEDHAFIGCRKDMRVMIPRDIYKSKEAKNIFGDKWDYINEKGRKKTKIIKT